MNPITHAEVLWYRKHGNHRDRLQMTRTPPIQEYVVGDDAWNAQHPDRAEWIEHRMRSAGCYPDRARGDQ